MVYIFQPIYPLVLPNKGHEFRYLFFRLVQDDAFNIKGKWVMDFFCIQEWENSLFYSILDTEKLLERISFIPGSRAKQREEIQALHIPI